MMATKTEVKSLDDIKQERDVYFLFILKLIQSDRRERNRILNGLRIPKVKRPAGAPRKHTDESQKEFLDSFEKIKAAAMNLASENGMDKLKLTDEKMFAMLQIYAIDPSFKQGKRLVTRINSPEFKRRRHVSQTRLSEVRKSRKLK